MKTIVKDVANRTIGRPDGSTTTLIELVLRKLREAALQGNVTEANCYQKLTAKFEPPEREEGLGFLVTPPPLPPHISPEEYAKWLAEQPVEKPESLYDRNND